MKLSLNDLVACLAFLASACHTDRSDSGRYEDDVARANSGVSQPAAAEQVKAEDASMPRTSDGSQQPALSREEVLGYLIAVNDNEIAAAKEADKKAMSPDAAHFAAMLLEQHTENNQATKALAVKLGSSPVENKQAKNLRERGSRELAELAALDGFEFERGYVGAMIKGHEEALRLIDEKLLPAARNDEIQKHLKTTRGHVAHHLELARGLDIEPKQ